MTFQSLQVFKIKILSLSDAAYTVWMSLQKAFFATAIQGHGRFGAIDAVCLEFNDKYAHISGTDTQRASVVGLEGRYRL